ncbi:MAG: type III-B CRISPR module RAMP protein Cmr6 [Bacillota bacterium]|nr:type III-B CRISPR module RAMP protein Cmr6 [Bacillota bacterium]
MDYPIPKASVKAWLAHKAKSPQNPGLIFDRFVQNWGYTQDKDREAKKKAWIEIIEATQKADKNLLKQWNIRWEATARAAGAETFTMKTDWRFVAGLGYKGPLEVGFTFHHYGFPILPGSSVKGIARTWGLFVTAENVGTSQINELDIMLTIDEEEKFKEKFSRLCSRNNEEAIKLASDFRAIFGTFGCSGQAVFFDAIPKEFPQLELDVMNPHYSEYYQDKTGKTPPANWFSPVPVYFLTVAKDSEFAFAVGWRGLLDNSEAHYLHALAREWLIAGLKNLGAGAKTSAGYGYFIASE